LNAKQFQDSGVLAEIAKIFNTREKAALLLRAIAFPVESIPAFETASSFWWLICTEIEHGIIAGDLVMLLQQALMLYPGNAVLNAGIKAYTAQKQSADEAALSTPSSNTLQSMLADIQQYPFVMTTLRCENLRAFELLETTFNPPKPGRGQWVVLLGENGAGKTTLLRAMVLAMKNRQLSGALLELNTAALIKTQALNASISIQIQIQDTPVFTQKNLYPQGQRESIQHGGGPVECFDPLPLFAYGCRRGSALGGADRDLDFKPLAAVRTLFDESANLIHAETWLKQLRLKSFEAGGAATERYETVLQTVCSVLPNVTGIQVSSDAVLVQTVSGLVPLAGMSDGYLTTIGWMIDLFARWLRFADEHHMQVNTAFNQVMTGLVLIDELDLHLHPRWQVQVIGDLKNIFPKMSFVVTTHNPLTLLGAEAGEIHVLRAHAQTQQIGIEQVDIPLGLHAEQVLTGEWFGLPTTLDRDTAAKIEQHQAILRTAVAADDPARMALEAELRARLGGFADTSLERLALTVAAELQHQPYCEMTLEDRVKLKSALKKRLIALQKTTR